MPQPSCAKVYKWKVNRLKNQSKYGTEKERKLAELSLLTLQRFKGVFLKGCKKDPGLPFYKSEEDYNTKLDKIEKIMDEIDFDTATQAKVDKAQEKINKILLQ